MAELPWGHLVAAGNSFFWAFSAFFLLSAAIEYTEVLLRLPYPSAAAVTVPLKM